MKMKKNPQKRVDNSKGLEMLNMRLLHEISGRSHLRRGFKSEIDEPTKFDEDPDDEYTSINDRGEDKTQFISFQKAMRVLLIFGQCLGLNPVTAILDNDVSKIRFSIFSWRFLYTIIIAIPQSIAACLCIYRLIIDVSINYLGYVCFNLSTWCTTILFIQVGSKWPNLVKEIFNSKLDKYVDPGINVRCNLTCLVLLLLTFVEYVLSTISKVSQILDCTTENYDFYEELTRSMFPWLFDTGLPYNILLSVIFQLNLLITTASWVYLDIFIICMSFYLTSVLNEVNKKILGAAEKNYLPTFVWGTLREDYTRATRMVRLFDDVFSGLILVSFTTNLFFTCLQLFFVLEHGFYSRTLTLEKCPYFPSGPFYGYESHIYLTYSLAFLIVRFLSVSLIAADVNVASSVPTTALYRIPSYSYTMEVQRFMDQIHDDVVALGGLDYFHITKELVLSVAGTILTYELVLLQLR